MSIQGYKKPNTSPQTIRDFNKILTKEHRLRKFLMLSLLFVVGFVLFGIILLMSCNSEPSYHQIRQYEPIAPNRNVHDRLWKGL